MTELGRRLVAVVPVILALSACRIDREYTYTQREDGFAMKAPILHTVRIHLDTLRKTLSWLQDAKDSRGVEDRVVRTYGGDSYSQCEVFDESNWTCTVTGLKGEILEKPTMKDGRLTRWYWTEEEKYETRYRFFGFRL
jgi:hypothetical protein